MKQRTEMSTPADPGSASNFLAQVESSWAALRQKAEEFDSLQEELTRAHELLNKSTAQIQALTLRQQEQQEACSTAQRENKHLKKEIKSLHSQLKQLHRDMQQCVDNAQLEQQKHASVESNYSQLQETYQQVRL